MARSSGATRRDLGLSNGQAGKGDRDRTSDRAAYNRNMREINFPHDDAGFVILSGRKRKTYV